MNKYLNKGLLYEWFNAGKIPILIGLVTWGFIAHNILVDSIARIKILIGTSESNNYTTVSLEDYFILGVIFLAIYIFANGNNKRNTTMFLCSGPHTKRQIKFNELICLLVTLGLFIMVYIYMAITIYVRNNEFMSIINGFFPVILVEILRLVLFGTIGILLMIEIDLLFSNSIIAYFVMILLGIATMCIIAKIRDFISYFTNYGSLMDKIFGSIVYGNGYRNEYLKRLSSLFFEQPYYRADINVIFKGVMFLIIIIAIMIFIFNVLEKRAKLEATSKIFSSKTNENILVGYLSLGVGAFMNILLFDMLLNRWIYRDGIVAQFFSIESIKRSSIDIISLGILTFISYKILKKALKAIG